MVLDAAALLALLMGEPVAERVAEVLDGARVCSVICSVNGSEVLQKSLHR